MWAECLRTVWRRMREKQKMTRVILIYFVYNALGKWRVWLSICQEIVKMWQGSSWQFSPCGLGWRNFGETTTCIKFDISKAAKIWEQERQRLNDNVRPAKQFCLKSIAQGSTMVVNECVTGKIMIVNVELEIINLSRFLVLVKAGMAPDEKFAEMHLVISPRFSSPLWEITRSFFTMTCMLFREILQRNT